jgi:hypothetical protein
LGVGKTGVLPLNDEVPLCIESNYGRWIDMRTNFKEINLSLIEHIWIQDLGQKRAALAGRRPISQWSEGRTARERLLAQ